MAPDSTSIDINKSLKDYLNRNEVGTSEEKSNLLASWSSEWNVKSWFRRGSVENEDSEENSSWLKSAEKDFFCASLSKKHRIAGFLLCIVMGIFCFSLAFFYLPVLLVKVRKFCLLYSLGNLFFFGSFSFLWGPCNHLRHLFSCERLPFTSVCFGSLFLTLYSALWIKSSSLTLLFAACQTVAIFWYTISYIPGSTSGFKLFVRMCRLRGPSSLIPV